MNTCKTFYSLWNKASNSTLDFFHCLLSTGKDYISLEYFGLVPFDLWLFLTKKPYVFVCVFTRLTFLVKADEYSTAPWTPCEATKTRTVVGCPIANLSSLTEVSGKIFKNNSQGKVYTLPPIRSR